MKTIALLGCGSLGGIIGRGIATRLSHLYRLVGVADIDVTAAQTLGEPCGCAAYQSAEELIALRPDYLIEATAPDVLCAFGVDALKAGVSLIILSVGALADERFYEQAKEACLGSGARLHVVSGAIGGLDLIRSALWAGGLEASIDNVKPPTGLNGAPYLAGRDLSETEAEQVFSGTARQAIAAFPKNVNVAVALAVAAQGVDETGVTIRSVPGLELYTHRIDLNGDFGRAVVEVCSRPSATNPRSGDIAAYSVLARLENLASPIVF